MVGNSSQFRNITIGFMLCLLLLTVGCSQEPKKKSTNPIATASAFLQGGDLYARANLHPKFSQAVLTALLHGEPIQVTYHFSFFRRQQYLPDLPLAKVALSKSLRLRLVTQRYEMHDLSTNKIHYTPYPDDAIRFFSNPRFVLLGRNANLKKESSYWLRVNVEIDHRGMSPLFRTLKQWLTIDQAMDYHYDVDFFKP
ncbi:MAG: DUF4390 domain-containing protein [Magnetococcales bacterium]|nr:DUF4390 domain-containing protein [Magnetococcales bacterium]